MMMFPVVRANGRHLFGELSRDVDRLLGQTFAASNTALPVDIYEEGDTLVLEADVPGATQEGIDITVENGELTIALKHKGDGEAKSSYFVRERRPGSVARTFRLPETADLDKVEAKLANGVLTLRVPKKEEAKPRQIPVK